MQWFGKSIETNVHAKIRRYYLFFSLFNFVYYSISKSDRRIFCVSVLFYCGSFHPAVQWNGHNWGAGEEMSYKDTAHPSFTGRAQPRRQGGPAEVFWGRVGQSVLEQRSSGELCSSDTLLALFLYVLSRSVLSTETCSLCNLPQWEVSRTGDFFCLSVHRDFSHVTL